MRSAREIACVPQLGDCGGEPHSAECFARSEAIQQAREDGARWMLRQIRRQAAVLTEQMVTVEDIDNGYFDPHHVRGVAP